MSRAAAAAALKGPKTDAKLKQLITLIQGLLSDGYHPIVFCRYIPTADYLAEHLTTALTKKSHDLRIEAVTGTLPPEEREIRVNGLSEHDGPRVLIDLGAELGNAQCAMITSGGVFVAEIESLMAQVWNSGTR